MPNHQATFWVRDDIKTRKSLIGIGDFVEVDGKVFRVIDEQNFSREGRFSKCLMQRLGGPTDQQVTNTNVDRAIINDY